MDKRLELVFNLTSPAQLFELYPPEGAVTGTPTYSVWSGYRGDDEPVEFTGNATVDTTSLVVGTASGYSQVNRRRVFLASTNGLVVGRRYILSNALGQREVVKVVAISANVYADTEYDLAYDYAPTTSTIAGFRLTFSPPGSFVIDESKLNAEDFPYRIRWEYVVAGVAGRYLQYFDLLRHREQPGLDDESLKDSWPDIAYMIEPERRERIMREAGLTLDKDLRLRRVDPALIAPQETRTQLLKDCFAMLAVRSGAAIPQGHDAVTALRTFTRAYLDALELAVQGVLVHTQNRGDDNVNPDPPRGLGFTS